VNTFCVSTIFRYFPGHSANRRRRESGEKGARDIVTRRRRGNEGVRRGGDPGTPARDELRALDISAGSPPRVPSYATVDATGLHT